MKALRLMALVSLAGCLRTGPLTGPLKLAPGVVESVSYTPSHTVTGIGPALSGRGGVAMTTATVPEEWVTMVRWMDGRIPQAGEAFAQSVRLGDTVWVEYAEKLRSDSTPTGELYVFGVRQR